MTVIGTSVPLVYTPFVTGPSQKQWEDLLSRTFAQVLGEIIPADVPFDWHLRGCCDV